jgi:hypothetical protein
MVRVHPRSPYNCSTLQRSPQSSIGFQVLARAGCVEEKSGELAVILSTLAERFQPQETFAFPGKY